MKTYASYEAAKIDNPECDILISNVGKFHSVKDAPTSHFANGWKLCNPADHCMTVERFLSDGHKFVECDIYLDLTGAVSHCGGDFSSDALNEINHRGKERYILRAAALEDKPKRTKVSYVEVNSVFELCKDELDSGNYGVVDSLGDYIKVSCEFELSIAIKMLKLVRRIETEIDERQEFIDKAKGVGICFFDGSKLTGANIEHLSGELYDSGKFKLVEGE